MCNQVQCLNVILVKQTKMFKTVIGITPCFVDEIVEFQTARRSQ